MKTKRGVPQIDSEIIECIAKYGAAVIIEECIWYVENSPDYRIREMAEALMSRVQDLQHTAERASRVDAASDWARDN